MHNIPLPTFSDNDFDLKILEKSSFIYSVPGILKADKRLKNKYRVHLLVAELFDLARAHGYAYCSNQFLAEKMGVSVDTIKRDLNLLQKCGYIERDTKFQDFRRQRKIYVANIFSNNFYQGANLHQPKVQGLPKEESLSPNGDNKDLSKDRYKVGSEDPPTPPLLFFSEYKILGLTKDDYEDLAKKYGKEKLDQELVKADTYLAQEGKKKKNYKAFMQNWMKREWNSGSSSKATSDDNRKWADNISKAMKKNFFPMIVFTLCPDYVEMGARNHPNPQILEYKDSSFRSKVEMFLKKCGAWNAIISEIKN